MTTLSLETVRNEIITNLDKVSVTLPEDIIEKFYSIYVDGKNMYTCEFTHGSEEYVFLGANFTISKLLAVRITNKATSSLISAFSIKH